MQLRQFWQICEMCGGLRIVEDQGVRSFDAVRQSIGFEEEEEEEVVETVERKTELELTKHRARDGWFYGGSSHTHTQQSMVLRNWRETLWEIRDATITLDSSASHERGASKFWGPEIRGIHFPLPSLHLPASLPASLPARPFLNPALEGPRSTKKDETH